MHAPRRCNVRSSEGWLLITEASGHETPHPLLARSRAHWRGGHIVLCEDRSSPHMAGEILHVARPLPMELRFLPTATPEMNVRDPPWRHVQGSGLANRATHAIDDSATSACRYVLTMRRRERLRQACVLSGRFWCTMGWSVKEPFAMYLITNHWFFSRLTISIFLKNSGLNRGLIAPKINR